MSTAPSGNQNKALSEMSRAELYAHLQTHSKDELVLAEMQKLGFWPSNQQQPVPAQELIQREAELQRQLSDLTQRLAEVQDPARALREMRKQRMAAAKQRRLETQRQRLEQKHQRALHWHQRRQHEILFLGEGVSSALNYRQSNHEKLKAKALPILNNAAELAQAIGITLAELRFLSFHREVSRVHHYRHFCLPKKSGGLRQISAPMPRLKRCQYWILDKLLAHQECHPAAHGFIRQHSILSNARPHINQAVVINLDLKDFFPSTGWRAVRQVFSELGYSAQVSTILALLSTEIPVQKLKLDGVEYYAAMGERHLPQGAPSSPMITNLLCQSLDKRLQAAAQKLGFVYTRYADDLSFSCAAEAQGAVGKLLWRVRKIIADAGYTLHPDKLRIMRRHQKQEVTGIVVNQKANLDSKTLHKFRATLHQIESKGLAGAHWQDAPEVLSAMEGYARYVCMVNPEKGQPWLARLVKLRQQYPALAQASWPQHSALRARVAQAGPLLRDNGAAWWMAQERALPEPPKLPEIKASPQTLSSQQPAMSSPPSAQGWGHAQREEVLEEVENNTADESTAEKKSEPPSSTELIAMFILSLGLAQQLHSVHPLSFGILMIALSYFSRRSRLSWFMLGQIALWWII